MNEDHVLFLPSANALLNACEGTFFQSRGKAGSNGIEIYVCHASNQGGIIKKRLTFEAAFPETAFGFVFGICGPSDEFI